MIQRIQTVWLLLAIVCIFLTMQFEIFFGAFQGDIQMYLTGRSSTLLVIVTSMIGVVSLISIFLFKNRKLQLRILLVALFLEFILLFLYYWEANKLKLKGTISIYSLFHAGVIIFLLLAANGIRKDEKLIKDSNRLR
jgi:hypothetical protein